MEFRKALRTDLDGIFELVKGLALYEKEPDSVTATIDDYHKAFDEGLINAFVAIEDNEIIGMAFYYMTFSTWRGHMLYLEDFYVKDEYRSKGIGQDLFDLFINEAKSLGCALAKWEVLDWNKKAIKFYERNGALVESHWWTCKMIF